MSINGWPRKISWREFEPVNEAPGGENGQAYIHSTFHFQYSSTKKDRNGWRLEGLIVKVAVDKGQSWVVKGKQHPELLNHEQGHYDITGLVGGRELHASLTSLRTGSSKVLDEQKEEIVDRIQKKVNRLQEKYDRNTKSPNGVIDPKKQEEWDKRIRASIENGKSLPDL
jgi:hypothetical protein